MCAKFHGPASALTLCCKYGEGESPSSSDIESQLNSETQVSCYHFREKRTHFPGLTGSYDFDQTLALIDQY